MFPTIIEVEHAEAETVLHHHHAGVGRQHIGAFAIGRHPQDHAGQRLDLGPQTGLCQPLVHRHAGQSCRIDARQLGHKARQLQLGGGPEELGSQHAARPRREHIGAAAASAVTDRRWRPAGRMDTERMQHALSGAAPIKRARSAVEHESVALGRLGSPVAAEGVQHYHALACGCSHCPGR